MASNPFNLRTLASLIGATPIQTKELLAEREPNEPVFGFISYQGAYKILRRFRGDVPGTVALLKAWVDEDEIKDRTRSFRQGALECLTWCATEVLPKIKRIERKLEGDRQRSSKLLAIGGVSFTGGFHCQVEWEDGTRRLVYFLGPKWSRKKVVNMLTLLQMKAAQVYDRDPQLVVIVDIPRREIVELRPIDPESRKSAIATARWLIAYVRDRAS